MGVWFGMLGFDFLRRDRSKSLYELGRTEAFCLRVKCYFAQDRYLGLSALVRDEFFFGNNPGEKSHNQTVVYDLKHRIQTLFKESELGNALFALLNEAARRLGLNKLNERDYYKAIDANLIPFDQLVRSHYRELFSVKKQKKIRVGTQKPRLIESSPLMTEGEMRIIKRFVSPFFNDLNSLAEDYYGQVYAQGFATVKKRIADSISRRWQILQKFAKVTKWRLQELRKIDPAAAGKRKAQVTPSDLMSLLQKRSHAPERFVQELKEIVGDNLKAVALQSLGIDAPAQEVEASIIAEIFEEYKSLRIIPIELPEVKKVKLGEQQIDYTDLLKKISKIDSATGTFKLNVRGIQHVFVTRIFGRISQAQISIQNVANLIDLLPIGNKAADIVIKCFYDGRFLSVSNYIRHIVETLSESIGDLDIFEATIDKFDLDDSQLKVITKSIEAIRVSLDRAKSRVALKA
jgi:Arc/MetJ-type ribon-helix-helix transcriptional regulator